MRKRWLQQEKQYVKVSLLMVTLSLLFLYYIGKTLLASENKWILENSSMRYMLEFSFDGVIDEFSFDRDTDELFSNED